MKKLPELILIGGSAGAISIILKLLSRVQEALPIPLVIVVHRYRKDEDHLLEVLSNGTKSLITICEATNNQPISPNCIYLAPANYHLLIEENRSFSLSLDPLVNYARPSIDILFESAAFVFGRALLGILLSGANQDGAKGCQAIEESGGNIIIQDPNDATHTEMPLSAIQLTKKNKILPANSIIDTIADLEYIHKRKKNVS